MKRVEDYALLSDQVSAALVSRTGSIDWLCWPRIDSDACFAALLGSEENGCWSLRPTGEFRPAGRRYAEDTMIVETDLETASGKVRLIDFMPVEQSASRLVRIVHCLEGRVSMRSSVRLRFYYGLAPPWIELTEFGAIMRIGPDTVIYRSELKPIYAERGLESQFVLEAGERTCFDLASSASWTELPEGVDAGRELEHTTRFWREWIGAFDKPTDWPDAVKRSLLTLKALIQRHTGAVAAAATTSLPERPGAELNWDYRYSWLRDCCFTLSALLNAGYRNEARHWRDWILRAIGDGADNIQIMYRVDGGRHLREWCPQWLSGFRGSKPVRIGNSAAEQMQLDVFGELIDAMYLSGAAGIEPNAQSVRVLKALAEQIEAKWRQPGRGLWESRREPRCFTFARAMAWAGLDRMIKGARIYHLDRAVVRRWTELRDKIHAVVCSEGYNEGLGSFVEYFGGAELDASVLLLPVIGFLPIDDPRIASTIDVIGRNLGKDGLVFRKQTVPGGGSEGAFIACSLWLADCRAMQGRREEAREIIEKIVSIRNDVGLLSEEYDPQEKCLIGNFPQAISHLSLVNSALALGGPVLQRGAA